MNEYVNYLESLKITLHDTNFNTEIFSENKKAFENARSFMKAPTQQPEIEAKIFTNIPTFDSDSTESAKQYIDTIYKFEEIQDSFFNGFLIDDEPTGLDDYFKETLI